jgi:hypothetical protein
MPEADNEYKILAQDENFVNLAKRKEREIRYSYEAFMHLTSKYNFK